MQNMQISNGRSMESGKMNRLEREKKQKKKWKEELKKMVKAKKTLRKVMCD